MLEPQISELLMTSLATPKNSQFSVEAARRGNAHLSQLLGGPQEPVASVEDVTILGEKIPVRIYRPSGVGPTPTIVYFHGAGWIAGDLDSYDNICRGLSIAANSVVVSVAYRLAPEYPYPAAPDDCTAAVRWAAKNIADLGGIREDLVVAGDSVGGNLAAVVTQRLTRTQDVDIALQVLLYPVLDGTMSSPSYTELSSGYYINRSTMQAYWKTYLAGQKLGERDPDISPLYAESLQGLPASLIFVAEYDPLRDEGCEYAERLRSAGVPVRLTEVPGAIHGFLRFRVLDLARSAMSQIGNAIRTALNANEAAAFLENSKRELSNAGAAVISKISAKPGRENDLSEASVILSKATVTETGCVSYHFHQSVANPAEFVFYEEFLTQSDLEVHLKAPHTKIWFEQMEQVASAPPEITRLKPIVSVGGVRTQMAATAE